MGHGDKLQHQHLAQELLTSGHDSGGSRSFAKELRALKMRIQKLHQKFQ